MAYSNPEEQLQKLQQKKEQILAKEKALKAQLAKKARNARTKRLIEIGAAVESVLGRPIEQEDLPKLIEFLQQQEQRGKFFSKAMDNIVP